MFRKALFLALSLSGCLAAAANPVVVVCKTAAPPRMSYVVRSYQVIFDEANQTVSVDGINSSQASISRTLITWHSHGEEWHIDRTDGSWSHHILGHGMYPEETEGGYCRISARPQF